MTWRNLRFLSATIAGALVAIGLFLLILYGVTNYIENSKWKAYQQGIMVTSSYFFYRGYAPSFAYQITAFYTQIPRNKLDIEFIEQEAKKRSGLGTFE
jgi:hypothetical protein